MRVDWLIGLFGFDLVWGILMKKKKKLLDFEFDA